MRFTSISTLLMSLIVVVIIAAIVYLFILLIRALRKYLRSGEVRQGGGGIVGQGAEGPP